MSHTLRSLVFGAALAAGSVVLTPSVAQTPIAAQSIDPAKMPDVIGIRLGMPLEQAAAILQRQYPGVRITPSGDRMPGIAQNVVLDLGLQIMGPSSESVNVDVLPPPNAPLVWRVYRTTNPARQPIGRAAMLAALREKYHREAFAFGRQQDASRLWPAENDDDIQEILWIFDAQGRNVPLPANPLDVTISRCYLPFNGPASPSWFLEEARDGALTQASDPRVSVNSFCATSFIYVKVALSSGNDPKFILSTITTAMHVPMAVRGEKATTAWWTATVEKLRQQQINQSNQVKPKL